MSGEHRSISGDWGSPLVDKLFLGGLVSDDRCNDVFLQSIASHLWVSRLQSLSRSDGLQGAHLS